jgi:WGR domain
MVKDWVVFFTTPVLDFRITLEARNPARQCSRQYRVEAGTDLFGVWVVEISYGRIGTAGRSRSYVLRDEGEARHLAQIILKRRASAPRRIGVAYRIRELIDPAGVGRGLGFIAADGRKTTLLDPPSCRRVA